MLKGHVLEKQHKVFRLFAFENRTAFLSSFLFIFLRILLALLLPTWCAAVCKEA
jgi:hypothetical protein